MDSPPLSLFAAFGASFLFVFLKAFQQRNVAFDHYRWIMPVSLGMAATEVYVIAQVVNYGWHILLVLSVGLGAGLGALSAMVLHRKYIMRDRERDE